MNDSPSRKSIKLHAKYTLREKIKRPYILLSAIILLLCFILLYLISSRIYWNKSEVLCEQLVSLNLDLLENEIMEVQNRQKMIAGNGTVKQAAAYYNQPGERDYTAELQFQRKIDEVVNTLLERNNVSAAYIVDKKGKIIYFHKESPKINYQMQEEPWFSDITKNILMDTCYMSGIHDRKYLVNETEEKCISTVCPIQGDGYFFSADAYLVCDIALHSVFDTTGKKGNVLFAVSDVDNQFYTDHNFQLTEKEEKQLLQAVESDEDQVEIFHKGFFPGKIAVIMKAQTYGLNMIGIKNLDEISDMAASLLILFCIAAGILLTTVAILSKRVAESVAQPVNKLMEECNRVAAGEKHVVFKEKNCEEIAFLSDTIQDMVENIVHLSGKLVEEERKLSEEKVRVLQHQINPHFLNNVLQTIKGLAVSGENEKVSRMATLLGQILAYSVYEPYENVTLKTELAYLKNYVELQNIRYDNRILCTIDCESLAADAQIPKLTLQPLVENAIEHGMSNKKNLILSVSADLEMDMVCVIINDNGKGMAKEEVENLLLRMQTGEACSQKSSIGILNVNERIQKMYGKEYGIRIHSRPNGGTSVIVYVPGKEKEKYESIVGR